MLYSFLMEGYKKEKLEEKMPDEVLEFIKGLSRATDEELPLRYDDGTFEVDTDSFTLTFTIEDDVLRSD